LNLYFDKVKPGAFITGDDYKEGGWWQGGFEKAVGEFLREGKVKLISI
jgi:hypothetical protein